MVLQKIQLNALLPKICKIGPKTTQFSFYLTFLLHTVKNVTPFPD